MTQPAQPQLRTRRLILRALQENDRDEFVRVHHNSFDLHGPWQPVFQGTHLQRFEAELARGRVEWDQGIGARFMAILADGRQAAYVNLSQIFRRFFLSAIMGWRVNAEVERQGYCTEAVRAVIDYALSPAGAALHRVQCAVVPTNAASLRVAAKAGFRREGLALRYLQIAGQWRDHVLFAKLVDEHQSFGTIIEAL
jgi:ribosomal-protein-alanine N-acetyltransferase